MKKMSHEALATVLFAVIVNVSQPVVWTWDNDKEEWTPIKGRNVEVVKAERSAPVAEVSDARKAVETEWANTPEIAVITEWA